MVLERGVSEILPSKKGLEKLMRAKKITLYQGFDPSSSSLHIGNSIGIRKLAQFQRLGHKVIFLIGDFTGMIGDPTDKSASRKRMTREEVLKNAQGYKEQISKVLEFEGPNAAEIKYNSEWLSKLSFEEICELASNFTAQQILERDFFQDRLKKKKPIYLHEFLYPLMQGYDCVAMDVNLEVGGSDQLFNMMAGRTLMKTLKGKEKYVLTMKLLEDTTGKKMGKTEGNTINLTDAPEVMFAKIMALPDTLIRPGIELLTDLSLDEIAAEKPMVAKKKLAFEVVSQVFGTSSARSAQNSFEKTFQEKMPDYSQTVNFKNDLVSTITQVVKSKSEAKRLIIQGAVDVNEKTETSPTLKIKVGDKLKVGQRIFVKVKNVK